MRRKHLFWLVVFACTVWVSSALAQVPDSLWTRYFDNADGEEICYGIAETSDQGLICAGWSTVEDSLTKAMLVKTGVNGLPLWARNYGRHQQATSVVQNSDGSYMVCGVTGLSSNNDFWMMKVNSAGDSLWSQTFGGAESEQCYAILPTGDGGYVLGGGTGSFGAGGTDFWLVKTDANGGGLWSQTYGSDGSDFMYDAAPTSDCGFILCGSTDSLNVWGETDGWLVRTDAFGDTLWTRAFGGQFDDFLYSVQQTPDGGFVAAGGKIPFDGATFDFFLVKMDANGNGMWTRTFGEDGDDECSQVRVLGDGGYIMSGPTGSYNVDGYGTLIVRLDADGDSLWSRVLRPDTTGYPFCATLVSDGGYVMGGGQLRAPGWDSDMMITKLASIPLGVDDPFILPPTSFVLSAYPNPFNPSTSIRYSLSRNDVVTLSVYDVNGRLVQTLLERTMPAGEHSLNFDAGHLPSGLYIARLQSKTATATHKLMLVK